MHQRRSNILQDLVPYHVSAINTVASIADDSIALVDQKVGFILKNIDAAIEFDAGATNAIAAAVDGGIDCSCPIIDVVGVSDVVVSIAASRDAAVQNDIRGSAKGLRSIGFWQLPLGSFPNFRRRWV